MGPRLQKLFDVLAREGFSPVERLGEITVVVDAKGYKAAALKLRLPANIGPGYENAQTALGDCLLKIAGTSDLSSDYLEGLTWLRRAADAGRQVLQPAPDTFLKLLF